MALPSLGRLPLAETSAKDDASGLTRSLKNARLVPTGACLPRGFDPHYCDTDPFYAFGLAIVSAIVGFVVDSKGPHLMARMADKISTVIQTACDPRLGQQGWWDSWYYSPSLAELPKVCAALDTAFYNAANLGEDLARADREEDRTKRLTGKIISMIMYPSWVLVGHPALASEDAIVNVAVGLAMARWTLKYIAHYMNEHALMVASFFRTNARRLSAGEAPMLDLVTFARQCREDIVDGPNPPPQPPAYEAFDPEAVAAERQRLDELRQRRENRDPLMEGIDYPETYASAGAAMPFRK